MKRFLTVFVVTLVLSNGAGLPAQTRAEGEKLLEAARRTAVIEGDPKRAAEMYKKLTDSKDPAIAVKAWLGMADAYRLLGDAEARKIYERIVNEFGRQADAVAVANERLASLQPTSSAIAGVVTKEIKVDDDAIAAVSFDGRYAYGEDQGILDLSAGTRRPFQLDGDGYSRGYARFSRDGKQLAYSGGGGWSRKELRVVNPQAAGDPLEKVTTLLKDDSIEWLNVHDWTPDNKMIVVSLIRKDKASYEIGLVSAADRSYRRLTLVDWIAPEGVFVNPADSRYIAFDRRAGETVRQHDIFVLMTGGNTEETTPLVIEPTHDTVAGWSPDGKYLIFLSQQASGETNLRALPFGAGKALAPPSVAKAMTGEISPLGITASGAFFYTASVPAAPRFRIEGFDLSSERLPASPATSANDIAGLLPAFSPDEKQIVYRNADTLLVRSLETGQTRELKPFLYRLADPRWHPDGLALVADGTDFNGRRGVYRINALTDQVSVVVECNCDVPRLSPIGTSLYFFRRTNSDTALVVRDLESGTEREVLKSRGRAFSSFEVSPDGQTIAVQSPTQKIAVVPVNGGQPRELVTGNLRGWTPDSKRIFVTSQGGTYLVSLDGASRKIADSAESFVVSPDGRRIATYVRPSSGPRRGPLQIYALENFLTVLEEARAGNPLHQLTWVDRSGKPVEKVGTPADYVWAFYTARALSPDGRRLAIPRPGTEGYDLWILDLRSGTMTREVSDIFAGEGSLAWSADSNRIAFVRQRAGRSELHVKRVDGTSKEVLRWETPNRIWGPTWSPDGTLIVVGVTALRPLQPPGDYDHWAVSVTGDRMPFPLPWNTPRNDGLAAISPDGRSIAFNRSREGSPGNYDIYVRSFPDGEREWPIPNGAGVRPAWRQDGKELYFSGGGSLKAVDVRVNGSSVQFGAPEALAVPDTALTLDGKRFLVLEDVAATKP